MNPVITAAFIAGGISVVSFAFNAWTTSRTLHSARAASLRDRQAAVYQQVLAFTSHQTETRRKITRKIRYDDKTEARLQGMLDAYKPPDWFELQSQVLAFCPDSVVEAFITAKAADDAVWAARLAHAEAVELNQADPTAADPNRVVALQAKFRARIKEGEMADSKLIGIVRDKMLGTRPSEPGGSLIGKVIFTMRSRTSLR